MRQASQPVDVQLVSLRVPHPAGCDTSTEKSVERLWHEISHSQPPDASPNGRYLGVVAVLSTLPPTRFGAPCLAALTLITGSNGHDIVLIKIARCGIGDGRRLAVYPPATKGEILRNGFNTGDKQPIPSRTGTRAGLRKEICIRGPSPAGRRSLEDIPPATHGGWFGDSINDLTDATYRSCVWIGFFRCESTSIRLSSFLNNSVSLSTRKLSALSSSLWCSGQPDFRLVSRFSRRLP